MYPKQPGCDPDHERGQTTIALAGVLAVGCLAAVALSIIGQAMVHRAHARNAADAVGLANAGEPAAAAELSDWYVRRGITIEQQGERTIARSGPSQAATWATTTASADQPAPALVAIVARAEQLLNVTLDPLQWRSIAVTFSPVDATHFREVAAQLGLCEIADQDRPETFELC